MPSPTAARKPRQGKLAATGTGRVDALGRVVRKKPMITIVIPVFNEEKNIRLAYEAVVSAFAEMGGRYDFEILFSDNQSTDGSFAALKKLAAEDRRVRVIRLARNFGFQRSVLTAYRNAAGDAAIQMDCDLQDPPALFAHFLDQWERGHDVVVGIRRNRRESFVLQMALAAFYRFLNRISEDNLTPDAGDFRLVDRSILDQLQNVRDSQPYLRGLVSTLAANQTGIPYDREERKFEQSKFPLRRLIGFAAGGIVNHSIIPLRLATMLGLSIFAGTMLISLYYLLAWAFGGREWPEGFATTTILILVGIGLNGIFAGILGEYVGRIYLEVRDRPTAVIQARLNFERSDETTSPRKEKR